MIRGRRPAGDRGILQGSARRLREGDATTADLPGAARRPLPPPAPTEDDLRAILNAVPALIGYWDREARNRLANDAYVEYFGKTPEEIRGRHISEVLGAELYEKNRPYIDAALRGEPQLFDRAIPTPSGETRYTQASYIPDVVDGEVQGFFVLVTDITARREAERKLAAAEERFRALFEWAPIGTFLADREMRILAVNDAGAELLGRPKDSLIGVSFRELTHPDDVASSVAEFERLLAAGTGSYRLEKRYEHSSGEEVWVQIDVTLLRDPAGEPTHALGHVQDISAQHQQQLEHLASHDPLTGLPNRRAFEEALGAELAYAERYESGGALVLLDLDNFKNVNDTLGHKAGDDLIIDLARSMEGRLRTNDLLGRLGGDEFAVILPHTDLDHAERVARSIIELVRERAAALGLADLGVSASAGVAGFTPGVTDEEMLVRADLAMYAAKDAGKDRVGRVTRNVPDLLVGPSARPQVVVGDRVGSGPSGGAP